MVGFILGILIAVAAIASTIYISVEYGAGKGIATFAVGAVIATVLILLGCVTSISTGSTGVVTVFGKPQDYTLDSGIHFLSPWANVHEMDNKTQKVTLDLNCFSSDIQEVLCRYTLNYQINREASLELYKTVGIDYYTIVIEPNIIESVKTVTACYTAEDLVSNREQLGSEIEALLSANLTKYNINVIATAVENLDFTDTFTNAVEAKQVAQQNKLRAATEQEQKTMEAQQAAERTKIDAEAAAAVAKIQAEADLAVTKIQADAAEYAGQKEAAKNNAIAKYLTPELIKYYLIQQWDGHYPTTYMGPNDITALVDVGVSD